MDKCFGEHIVEVEIHGDHVDPLVSVLLTVKPVFSRIDHGPCVNVDGPEVARPLHIGVIIPAVRRHDDFTGAHRMEEKFIAAYV